MYWYTSNGYANSSSCICQNPFDPDFDAYYQRCYIPLYACLVSCNTKECKQTCEDVFAKCN